MKQPINSVDWLDAKALTANDYNPNVVLDQELRLLKFSLLRTGWLQPILITKNMEIIDGFHRWWLTQNDEAIKNMTDGLVPCVVLDLDEPQRMMLTIRINRAKGNHVSFKMHEIISKLYNEMAVPQDVIAKEIGADAHEINLLLQEGVFAAKNIKEHKYSKAWIPVKKVEKDNGKN
jgi:ParB-like chromosome segregation protein Spo0J